MKSTISDVQKKIKVGTHGEDYGSWMSNPVFYVFGGIALVTLVLTALSFTVFRITVLGVVFAAATVILVALLCPYGIITTNRKSPVYQWFSVIWQGFSSFSKPKNRAAK